MTIPLLIAGVTAAALFLPGCDWFTDEEPPPVKERDDPVECDDPSVITKKTKVKVPGLG